MEPSWFGIAVVFFVSNSLLVIVTARDYTFSVRDYTFTIRDYTFTTRDTMHNS